MSQISYLLPPDGPKDTPNWCDLSSLKLISIELCNSRIHTHIDIPTPHSIYWSPSLGRGRESTESFDVTIEK